MSNLHCRTEGRIAIITLDRPAHGNRVSTAMAEALSDALEAIRRNPAIGACVLTGAGEHFCLGGDHQGAGNRTVDRLAFARAFSDAVLAMARLGKPIVAAINGNAHAGGFSLLTCCDLAVLAEDATLGLPEAAKGLFPLVALAVMRHTLPPKLFFDIIYSARLMPAAEALAHQLVNELQPRPQVLARATALAEQAASRQPAAVAIGRNLYHATQAMSLEQALEAAQLAVAAGMAAVAEGAGA